MATPNYAFAKRQKELAKKAKKEEKKQAKLRGEVVSDSDEDETSEPSASLDVTALTETSVQPN